MLNTLYIDWQPNVEIFNLFGYSVRWYAMGWIMSVLVPYFIVRWLYKDQGIDPVLTRKENGWKQGSSTRSFSTVSLVW